MCTLKFTRFVNDDSATVVHWSTVMFLQGLRTARVWENFFGVILLSVFVIMQQPMCALPVWESLQRQCVTLPTELRMQTALPLPCYSSMFTWSCVLLMCLDWILPRKANTNMRVLMVLGTDIYIHGVDCSKKSDIRNRYPDSSLLKWYICSTDQFAHQHEISKCKLTMETSIQVWYLSPDGLKALPNSDFLLYN